MPAQVLTSKWTGLSPSLLATIYPVDARGVQVDGPVVVSPPTEGNTEITANWQSPFEQAGAESKIPSIMSMLQSGTLQSYSETLLGKGSDDSIVGRLAREIEEFSTEGQGRSGMTKLNSTQVFTGAAPIKIPLTLQFRAFSDPASEVHAPIDQLAQWTLARQLAKDGSLISAIKSFKEGQGFLKALLPSQAPQMVGLRFGGYTWAPLVLESMSFPMAVPRSGAGKALNVAVNISLATLTALDQGDWLRAMNGQPTQLFNS